jgi:hypothetical protein
MKNILAENMLRFGVKNLSNSDVKKINESSLLTEGFKGQDGITYALNFKDQAAFDTYYTDFPQILGATPPWLYRTPKDSDQRSVAQINWSKERFNLMKCIMLAMAHQGYPPRFLSSEKYTDVVGILAKSAPVLSKVYNSRADTNFSLAYSDFQSRIKDWQKMITPDPAKPAIKITYWEQFQKDYLVPIIAAKTALIVPKAKPAVNPTAPVKN